MKSALQANKNLADKPIKWIFTGLITVTLYFQSSLADPFNSPKSWILMIIAAWLTGYIFSTRQLILSIKPIRNITYFVIAFIFFLAIASLFTDFHFVAMFGDTQRRNGFLSYLSLSIILVASAIYINIFNVIKLFKLTYFIGVISAIYALMQTTGNDFVNWNNPYNAIIGTVGNPNFAAAVMAVMAAIITSSVFISKFKLQYRMFGVFLSLLLVFLIIKSNAKQGLLSYIIGVGVFLIIWIWGKDKRLGILGLLFGIFIFFISTLGMLQFGPLEKYLYKPSVSIRGYYWRAGLEMFKHYPLTGVGIDSYGFYFKQFRELNYPLIYGFEITSTNAHNTFIQFFATSGIFLGLVYLLINGYILKCAIYSLKELEGDSRLLLAGIFSAWVAFHSQSLVSIDNLGVSIWGWVLGGTIIGLSISSTAKNSETGNYLQKKQNQIDVSRVIISGTLTLMSLILVGILYRGEIITHNSTQTVNLQDPTSRAYYKDLQLKVINTPLNDPTYKLFAAANLIQSGFIDEGLSEAKNIYLENPRNLDALKFIAATYEQISNFPEAIKIREKLSELDPWNAANYLALGKLYRTQGDLVKSKAMLDKILSFASKNSIAQQANAELAS